MSTSPARATSDQAADNARRRQRLTQAQEVGHPFFIDPLAREVVVRAVMGGVPVHRIPRALFREMLAHMREAGSRAGILPVADEWARRWREARPEGQVPSGNALYCLFNPNLVIGVGRDRTILTTAPRATGHDAWLKIADYTRGSLEKLVRGRRTSSDATPRAKARGFAAQATLFASCE